LALANRPSILLDQTSSSPSIDSSSTPWKRSSGNTSKRLIAIQRSDRMLLPFRSLTQATRDQTSTSPSIDSLPTPWKRPSGNSSKSLIAIQRSDRKLWPFRTVHVAWLDQTSSSPSMDSYPLHGKGHPETLVKVGSRSNGRIECYCPFEASLKQRETRPHHRRVSIPYPLHRKGHPESPVKV